MNETLSEVETIVKDCEARILMYNRQLTEHEEGLNKLTPMVKASCETKLENTIEQLERYKLKQDELLELDSQVLIQKEQELLALRRKKYFDNQNKRIKRSREYLKDTKIEALTILCELPQNVHFEDEELFDIASESLRLEIREHTKIYDVFLEIKEEFNKMLNQIDAGILKSYRITLEHIPYVVFYLSIFSSYIKESKKNDEKFKGFFKYEDWWINELWRSHQAYFALYKWKKIIDSFCTEEIEKNAWDKVFTLWLDVKRFLNIKGEKVYELTLIFDNLVSKYAGFEEELDEKKISNLEKFFIELTQKEDFSKTQEEHNIHTPYLIYKEEL